MRYLALLTLLLPTIANADELDDFCKSLVVRSVVRYENKQVCEGGYCRIVRQPVYGYVAAKRLEAVSPKSATPFRFASLEESLVPELPTTAVAAVLPAVNTAAAGQSCNCAVTGVCTCDPALCRCASCQNGSRNMAASGVNMSYAASAGEMKAFSSPRGPVTIQRDANGTAWITHSGGVYGRQLARHLRRGVRLGVE